ncbi:MAG: FkbM family methyltransferase [Caldilineaceae bacterium]|nr:FkbM family methyltransferase [Caldilineaceae bacterium]
MSIFHQIFVQSEYDFRKMKHYNYIKSLYISSLKHGERPLIIDCGAHIGLSVIFLKTLFPNSKIIAIEPNSENVEVLSRNIIGYDDITIIQGGIWNKSDILYIQNPSSGSTAYRLDQMAVNNNKIKSVTVQDIMLKMNASWCLVVKIDIEGGEYSLFYDNLDWLDKVSVLIIELHDWLYPWSCTSSSLFKALGERNFDCTILGENLVLFRKISDLPEWEAEGNGEARLKAGQTTCNSAPTNTTDQAL